MELFNTLKEQLTALWKSWSPAQKVGISSATVACILAVFGTLYWATRPNYVVLASQLTPQHAAEIVGLLETAQIDTRLNFSASAVSVPSTDIDEARLAIRDVLDPSMVTAGDDSLGSGFPGSPRAEDDRMLRNQEQRIARSIERIRGIREATVHISKPERTPFTAEQSPTTASILVTPASAGSLTNSIAESIVSTVSRSVEGLLPENVSLIDTVTGREFSLTDGMASSMGAQFDYQRRIEMNLANKAESMLARMLGDGKSVVRVTADIDFRETTRTEHTFDPDTKVKIRESIETVTQTGGGSPTVGGPVGTTPYINQQTPASGSPSEYKTERNETDYDNTSIDETVRDIPGSITRLTIAAIVDLTPPEVAEGETPQPALQPEQVEKIIKQAVGFDATRSDELEVLIAPLNSPLLVEEAPGLVSTWEQYEPLVQPVLVGLGAVIAFFMGLTVLKKIKPVVVTQGTEPQMTLSELQRLASISQQAKQNPEVAATILQSWLGAVEEEEQEGTGSSPTQRRAA
jgi:flagellar M-ring protein FliF